MSPLTSTLTPTLAAPPQAPSATEPGSADKAALKKAAQGFEAIFVRQMLAAARSTSLAGEDDLFGGQAQETFTSMRDEHFADIAAQTGAFGLAKQLEAQFAHLLPSATLAGKD